MPEPRVTVAMSVYNNAPWLGEAIESILGQTFPDFEFLIVNDGSTDGSGAIIDGYAASDPRIRVIHQDNRGLVASLNRLIEEAHAPLIARMDGDDVSQPKRLERQYAFLAANPDHGVVGTCTDDIDLDGSLLLNHDFHPLDHASFLEAVAERGPLLCHPSVMMRTDLAREVGGYRSAFAHCEDYDLWLRLASRTKLCSLPDRLLHYRRSPTQVSKRYVVEQQIGAAVAFEAYRERAAGRPDPTEGIAELPPVDDLDKLFGRKGVASAVRGKVAPNIVYSGAALTNAGYDLLLDHIRGGGSKAGLWRAAARLLKLGAPRRAAKLAMTLAFN